MSKRVFEYLMRKTVTDGFRFPGGVNSQRTLNLFVDSIERELECSLNRERITGFCICQIYCISDFGSNYLKRWKVAHSFGKKAIGRYMSNSRERRYYEDKWLRQNNTGRHELLEIFTDRSRHPLHKFIYPEYEEATKKRMFNSEVGFYICRISTLLWTPFSDTCRRCRNSKRCRDSLNREYPELYRIREETYKKGER